MKIRVRTLGDECIHTYRQTGSAYGKWNRPCLMAMFQCEHCGKQREMAVGMNRSWLQSRKAEVKAVV